MARTDCNAPSIRCHTGAIATRHFTVSGQDVVPVLQQVPRGAGDLACVNEHMGQHTAGTQGSQGVKQPTPMIWMIVL